MVITAIIEKPIQLFVEKLTPDKTFGYTYNHAMLMENANRIKIVIDSISNEIPYLIFAAGRYICVIMIDPSDQLGMAFYDLQKDKFKAIQTAAKLNRASQKDFMQSFETVNKNYDRRYKLVELIENKDFQPNLLAN